MQTLERRISAMRDAAKALPCKMEIIVLKQDNPGELLTRLKPDVYLLGSDYRDQAVPGAEHCGLVIFVERLPGFSTTELSAKT